MVSETPQNSPKEMNPEPPNQKLLHYLHKKRPLSTMSTFSCIPYPEQIKRQFQINPK